MKSENIVLLSVYFYVQKVYYELIYSQKPSMYTYIVTHVRILSNQILPFL